LVLDGIKPFWNTQQTKTITKREAAERQQLRSFRRISDRRIRESPTDGTDATVSVAVVRRIPC
jgi:hypothetical protein